jgi:Zn-dependent M28 family amino/carboxypeptidase
MRWFADGKIGNGVPEIRFNAVMSPAGTETLFAGAKRPLSAVFDAGAKAKPDSFDLPWKVRARVVGELKETRSPNVAAILRGSDPLLSSEYVVYTAHLDHEGMGRAVAGDSIFNGAYDNASGCAAMIEVARAFTALPKRPRRSILFLAVTAEEKGLQGADYFANYPTVPVERIVANLNMDMFLALTPVADVVGFGAEHSTLGKVLERAAGEVGFTVSPDFAPEEVVFIRSDQFPFVKKGIPAIFVTNGVGSLDPAVDGRKLVMEWMVRTYHSRSDDMGQPIHFPSLKRFAELNFLAGFVVASEPAPPRWNDGDFFARKFSRTHN